MNAKLTPFLPAGVLLVGVFFISGIRPQLDMEPLAPMSSISTKYEGSPGIDLAIDTAEQRIAGMSQFILREFPRDTTSKWSIYVGYYNRQVQGQTIHSPKNCLPGAGWDIMENDAVPLSDAAAIAPRINRVVLSNKGARALVYYWYQGRGRIAHNEYRVKWDLLRDAALHGRTEEALVRLVIYVPPVPTGTSKAADLAMLSADSLARRVMPPLAESVYKVLPPLGRS
ncbi:MAG: EpsI family protein [Phycisphaerae bacterium]|nr:EpsI family protein [Gemmatimonadaceae bacterium]